MRPRLDIADTGVLIEITHDRQGALHLRFDIGVQLDLQDVVDPRTDASATLATVGLVAEAVINFVPGTSAEPLPEGAVIAGTMERGLMDMGGEIGGSVKDVLAGVKSVEFKQLSDNLNKTLTGKQMTHFPSPFENTSSAAAASSSS